jgi:uncharacterized membrane protein
MTGLGPKMVGICSLLALLLTLITVLHAETVIVKYRGTVDLSHFNCQTVTRSSLVKRLCYDPKERYVIVNLTGTYYHYCEVPSSAIDAWKDATSMGSFYNAEIKGRFDCRNARVPQYDNK